MLKTCHGVWPCNSKLGYHKLCYSYFREGAYQAVSSVREEGWLESSIYGEVEYLFQMT